MTECSEAQKEHYILPKSIQEEIINLVQSTQSTYEIFELIPQYKNKTKYKVNTNMQHVESISENISKKSDNGTVKRHI